MVMIGTKTLLRHMARKHMIIHMSGNSCADGVGVGVGVGGSVSHAAASGTISKTRVLISCEMRTDYRKWKPKQQLEP